MTIYFPMMSLALFIRLIESVGRQKDERTRLLQHEKTFFY